MSRRSHTPAHSRRNFLKSLSAAATAAWLTGEPRVVSANESSGKPAPEARADACILLWMAGGMAAPDTFDPKQYRPFEKGTPVEEILSTFPAIDTALDGVQICDGLPEIAQVLDRGTLIRSHVQPDLGHILHSRHQYHWHTGYVPPQTIAAPHIGAWVAKLIGAQNDVMPAFVNVGQRLQGIGEVEEIKAFTTAGFLGSEYGPMNLPEPNRAAEAVRPPANVSRKRFAERFKTYQKLIDESAKRDLVSDYQRESVLRSLDNAYRLLSAKERAAFDLALEPQESFDAYNTSRFGRGCLLARRLVEAGSRFVEVTTEYTPFLHWDTHNDGHTTLERMHKEIDRPIAQLVRDLDERGLLDRTLIVLASEFSRDMLIEGVPGSTARDQSRAKTDVLQELKQYGLHRHFTGGSSVLTFGGGVKRGTVYGKTADERPCLAIENPVSVMDMHATMFTALGIRPDTAVEVERRPVYVTEDGKGKAVTDIFARA